MAPDDFRRLFPFTSRFANIDGHALHYIDETASADLPPLLLLHGNPTWSFLYRDIVAQLRGRFRCIALDYPGFGCSVAAEGYDHLPESHARVVERFVAHLGLTDLTLMVQDWGGPIGLWVAGRMACQVRAIVIGNSWAWPIDGDPHFERFSKVMGGTIGGLAIRHANAFINVILRGGVRRKKLSREIMGAYRMPFPTASSRGPMHVFPRAIRGSSAFLAEVEAGLARMCHLPTLIIWGDRDPAFRANERLRFEALFPRHRTLILEGASHYIQEEAPDEIAAAIAAWWDDDVVLDVAS